MRHLLAAALLGLITSVSAAPGVILQQVKTVPPGWSFHSHANTSESITLFVALKEVGIGGLKAELDDRQNSAHPSFGQHLSHDEVVQYRQPAAAAASAVTSWLQAGGVGNVRPQGSLLSFEATAQTLKTLLGADLAYYAYNGSDAAPVLRALSYEIPTGLLGYVNFIHPLTSFIPPRPRPGHHRRPGKRPKPGSKPGPNSGAKAGSKPGVVASSAPTSQPPASSTLTTLTSTSTSATQDVSPTSPCFAETVPDCIKELYNITYAPSTANPTPVRFGIAGFLEQWIQYADVSAFLTTFAPSLPASAANFTIETVNNGTAPQSPSGVAGLEASLDVEYAVALTRWATANSTNPSNSVNITYYSTGGRGTKLNPSTGQPVADPSSDDNEPYLPFLEYLLAKPDNEVPHVLSISYADDEPSVPQAYASRVCDMFAALAARGCTILVATGDGGAAGTGGTQCVRLDTNSSSSSSSSGATPNLLKRLVPTFPASCPYVTAVGATDNVGPPLTAADFSAGGFSDYFPRPSWQDAVVQPYLASLLANTTTPSASATNPSPTLYNATGRATPDLSAIGASFQVLAGGSLTSLLGTSASTPVVAALVALVNDARLRKGKASLGWLNPVLYSERVRGTLVDVTEGGSVGCVFPDGMGTVGWAAGRGFDAVTGLGVVGDLGVFAGVLV